MRYTEKYVEFVNWHYDIKNADVFINASPEKIFDHMPFGRFAHSERGLDWFAKVAKNEFNNYFLACDGFQT